MHGDHARVFYQVPVNARKLPLVMWHGFGQFAKAWETTADGREGYQTVFLRRRFPVYLVDQLRRGGAARSTAAGTSAPRETISVVQHVPPGPLAWTAHAIRLGSATCTLLRSENGKWVLPRMPISGR